MAMVNTKNVRIDIIVEGISNGKNWSCGMEFDYINEESLICRPIRKAGFEDKSVKEAKFTEIPREINEGIFEIRKQFLPAQTEVRTNLF